ncbi:MAG: helicase-related protein [Candidatus Thorarchaeota archaeon]
MQRYDLELTEQNGKRVFAREICLHDTVVRTSDGKTEPSRIVVRFEKSWERLDDGLFRVQVRIVNLSDEIYLYEPEYDELTVVGALALDDNDVLNGQESFPAETLTASMRIALGALLEFDLKEELQGSHFWPSSALRRSTPIVRVFNVIPQEESPQSVTFADYLADEELIPSLRPGRQMAVFEEHLQNEGISLEPEVVQAFRVLFSRRSDSPMFYAYQEEGIESILREMRDREGRPHLISVRTAGGKTELFLAPLIDYCIKNISKRGTKALVFYPTKALANDQSRRLFDLLCEVNRLLREHGKRPITMGVYHGGIQNDTVSWVPFKCPECGSYLELMEGSRTKLTCTKCANGVEYDFAYLTRNEIHRDPPDILITNPDTINFVLATGGGRQSFLGKHVSICDTCGSTIPYVSRARCRRPNCSGKMVPVKPDCGPEILIFDEIHLFYGAFGCNVINLNKRLLKVIRENTGVERPPVWIGSSATIQSPEKFGSKFFCCDVEDVVVIPSDPRSAYLTDSISSRRHALFLLPRNYSGHDTVGYSVAKIMEWTQARNVDTPRILAFTNSIRDCNHLIGNVRNRIPELSDRVDGHNTQFSKEDRAEAEMRFNRGELCALFATSTLEVGVDFSDVDVLIVYHAPPNFNAYLQRVGRAGRNSDALVISVLNNKSANDYYYFENARDLLRNKERYLSRIPVTARNPRVTEKHMIAAFFDWIQQHPKHSRVFLAKDLFSNLFGGNHAQHGKAFNPSVMQEIRQYMCDVFGIDYAEQIDGVLSRLADDLLSPSMTTFTYVTNIFDFLRERYFFMDLRQSDPTVTVRIVEAYR